MDRKSRLSISAKEQNSRTQTHNSSEQDFLVFRVFQCYMCASYSAVELYIWWSSVGLIADKGEVFGAGYRLYPD